LNIRTEGDEMAIEAKIEKKNGYTIRWTEKGNKVVDMPVGNFPFKPFEEWNKDCKENFSDVRWMKILHDHQISKMAEKLIDVKKPEEAKKIEEKKESEVIEDD
jgi:hypothetical protein